MAQSAALLDHSKAPLNPSRHQRQLLRLHLQAFRAGRRDDLIVQDRRRFRGTVHDTSTRVLYKPAIYLHLPLSRHLLISLRILQLYSAVGSAKGHIIDMWGSRGISEPAPHITFLPPCISHTTVSTVTNVGSLVFEAVNHLVPFTSLSRFVFLPQENDKCE